MQMSEIWLSAKRLCSCNMNGISCTEACACVANDNRCKNPRSYLLDDADDGDDDSDDEDRDYSEILINNIIL